METKTVNGEALFPEGYPARCDVSHEELVEMKERFFDEDDDFGQYVDSGWPPRDDQGNVYPIFFDTEEVDDRGKIRDHNWYPYDPFGGNLEPITREELGACNAPMQDWRNRYPEVRFCGRPTNMKGGEYDYCSLHKGRKEVTQTAEEAVQTGLYVQSVDHLYEKLSPWKKLIGWGTFESLMGESAHTFAPEYEERTLDFSDEPFQPDGVDDDGVFEVKFGYPTDHVQRALALYVAAMKTVTMITVQPKVMHEDREAGEGMMEERGVQHAQLTAPPSEHDSSPQQFETIEGWEEHHLNLPLSRVISDQPKLLEMGGVSTDPTAESNDNVDADDIVLELQADVDGVDTVEGGTDPNAFEDYEAESEKMLEKADSHGESSDKADGN
jgi:hypothetical protein